MEKLFSVSEAAKLSGLTGETLRHYDRIGLVRPSRKDEWTRYRYYTPQDIIRLNTVHALTQMDLSLREIREVLEYDDLNKIIDFLHKAEQRADEKIRDLQQGREKIRRAMEDYARKLGPTGKPQSTYLLELPQRVILLSDTLESPTLENLWNYLGHFYSALPEESRKDFAFEDLAGIYLGEQPRMFAQCQTYEDIPGLKKLPGGTWLCADCPAQELDRTVESLRRSARETYHAEPGFSVALIVISGILQWTYQVQILIEAK